MHAAWNLPASHVQLTWVVGANHPVRKSHCHDFDLTSVVYISFRCAVPRQQMPSPLWAQTPDVEFRQSRIRPSVIVW